ncbi:MAG: LacI family transcriptional regulator [Lentisphaerae bacterium]|nr:MAG: LacI family transcriptional regulator [Lentisphaerota bacterium]
MKSTPENDEKMENMDKITTLKELAELCGVSRQAVSAALNLSPGNNTRISREKAEYIRKLAKKYHFTPNRTAQKLRARRHDAYGLVVSNLCRIALPTLVVLLDELKKRDKLLVVDSISTQPPFSRFLKEQCVDAILSFDEPPSDMLALIEKAGYPLILVNSNIQREKNCLVYNEAGALRLAARHLLEHGRRHIGLIQQGIEHYSGQARIDTYRQLVSEGVLAGEYVLQPSTPIFDEELESFLTRHPSIDALILGSTDPVVVYRVLAKLGRTIPADVAIVRFAWPGQEYRLQPASTTLEINQNVLGATIADLLEQAASGKQPTTVTLDYYLAVRDSSR